MKRLVFAAAVLAAACGGSQPVQTPSPPEPVDDPAQPVEPMAPPADAGAEQDTRSLYERLGGQPAIVAVVDDFVGRTTSDPRIKDRFFNTDATNLKRLLVEFVCMATGGPCQYTGRDMHTSHAGMELVDEEFTALVEDLTATLDKFQVGAREKGELLGALGPLHPQMVMRPDQLRPIAPERLAEVTAAAASLAEPDAEARRLLERAVIAGQRGQRSYAEQLFTRAELQLGAERVAAVAGVFREGAPPRVAAAPTPAADLGPQPVALGSSEVDAPEKKPARSSLRGTLQIGGGPVKGLGVVMLTPDRGGKKRVPKHRVIEQRDKAFAPHILAVPVGSTVAFPNFDRVFHNVFSL
jgi:hemoglobin